MTTYHLGVVQGMIWYRLPWLLNHVWAEQCSELSSQFRAKLAVGGLAHDWGGLAHGLGLSSHGSGLSLQLEAQLVVWGLTHAWGLSSKYGAQLTVQSSVHGSGLSSRFEPTQLKSLNCDLEINTPGLVSDRVELDVTFALLEMLTRVSSRLVHKAGVWFTKATFSAQFSQGRAKRSSRLPWFSSSLAQSLLTNPEVLSDKNPQNK